MVNAILIRPMELVINPFLIDGILFGTKSACMIQGDFRIGQRVVFQFHHEKDSNKTVSIAKGVIVAGIGLKIVPKDECIYKWTGLAWEKCGKESVHQIIRNEGIKKTDDFWKNIEDESLEVNQIYFDITEKLI